MAGAARGRGPSAAMRAGSAHSRWPWRLFWLGLWALGHGLCSAQSVPRVSPAAAASSASAVAPSAPAPQKVEISAAPAVQEDARDATLLTQVVGRDELDAYGDSSVLDVLARVSGVSIEGEQPRLRGLGGGYTLILLNGEPAPPGFSIDSLAPSDIERIEIVKGPSAEHGGVAGTINVVLRRPLPSGQQEWRAQLGYRAVDAQGNLAWIASRRIGDWALHHTLTLYSWANGASSEGERLSRESSAALRETRSIGQQQWRGGGLQWAPRIEWKWGPQTTLSWQAYLQNQRSRNTSEGQTEVLQGTESTAPLQRNLSRNEQDTWRNQAQLLHRESSGRRLEWRIGAQGQEHQSQSQTWGRALDASLTSDRASRQSLEDGRRWVALQWREPLNSRHGLLLGVQRHYQTRSELRREFEAGQELLSGTFGRRFEARTRTDVLYAQHEWQSSDRWAWQLGLRWEQAHARAQATAAQVTATSRAWRALLPTLNARHALDAKGQRVLRFGLSRSIRTPELALLLPRYALNGSYDRDTANTPLAADTAGNPDLRPEFASGLELALEQGFGQGGTLSAGLFVRHIEGLIRRRIALETVPEASLPRWVSRPVNFGRARSQGVELEAKGRAEDLLAGLWAGQGFRLRAALSLYRSAVEQIDDPEARLEGQPPWQLKLGVDQQLPRSLFGWSASLSHTPAFATRQTDRQRVWRGAQQQLDATLRWRFSRQTQLNLSMRNVLAPVQRSQSSIEDIDGFAARSASTRSTAAVFNLSFTHRL
jgi:outer membrane receptor for ferrienterochelin and colicins